MACLIASYVLYCQCSSYIRFKHRHLRVKIRSLNSTQGNHTTRVNASNSSAFDVTSQIDQILLTNNSEIFIEFNRNLYNILERLYKKLAKPVVTTRSSFLNHSYKYDHIFSKFLNKSVLGAASGIMDNSSIISGGGGGFKPKNLLFSNSFHDETFLLYNFLNRTLPLFSASFSKTNPAYFKHHNSNNNKDYLDHDIDAFVQYEKFKYLTIVEFWKFIVKTFLITIIILILIYLITRSLLWFLLEKMGDRSQSTKFNDDDEKSSLEFDNQSFNSSSTEQYNLAQDESKTEISKKVSYVKNHPSRQSQNNRLCIKTRIRRSLKQSQNSLGNNSQSANDISKKRLDDKISIKTTSSMISLDTNIYDEDNSLNMEFSSATLTDGYKPAQKDDHYPKEMAPHAMPETLSSLNSIFSDISTKSWTNTAKTSEFLNWILNNSSNITNNNCNITNINADTLNNILKSNHLNRRTNHVSI